MAATGAPLSGSPNSPGEGHAAVHSPQGAEEGEEVTTQLDSHARSGRGAPWLQGQEGGCTHNA